MNFILKKTAISVIIPMYNTEFYLSECLDSLVNQTIKNFEVIIVDDGSTDKSLEIAEMYKSKLNLNIIKQENQGASAARNNGMTHAKGKYIAFMDSDDVFATDALENMYNTINKNKSDVVIGKRGSIVKGELIDTSYRFPELYAKPVYNSGVKEHKFLLNIIGVPSKMFRKDFLVKNKINFVEGMSSEDFIFSYEVALHTEKYSTYVDSNVYYYRAREKGDKSITQDRLSEYNLISRFKQMDATYEITQSEKGKEIFQRNEAKINFQTRLFRHLRCLKNDEESEKAFKLIQEYVIKNFPIIEKNCNKNYKNMYKLIATGNLEQALIGIDFIVELKKK